MNRIERSELKEYLIRFAVSKLENCALFSKTFGKKFVKKSLDINFRKVYIGEYNSSISGYYDSKDLSVTLNSREKERIEELTPKDIENDSSLKATTLHELVHAVLNRTKFECLWRKLQFGTGILEKYTNGEELGRGLNEGLTNWICEKAEVETYSYEHLTKFVKLLELAIGEERVMKLAMGNIRRNATKQLSMTKEEATNFLAMADDVYRVEDNIVKIEGIIEVLKRYSNRDTLDSKEREELEREYKSVTEDLLGYSLLHGKEWRDSIERREFENNLNGKIKFLKKKVKKEKKVLCRHINNFQETIFNKYFRKIVEEASQMSEIPESVMRKLDKIYQGIDIAGISADPNEMDEIERLEISKFKIQYRTISNKYEKSLMQKAREIFMAGKLSASKLRELEKQHNRGRYDVDKNFISDISYVISPEDTLSACNVLYRLAIKGELDKLNESELNLAPEEEYYPVVIKENLWSRAILAVKRKLFTANSDEIVYNANKDSSEQNKFKERISDMSRYGNSNNSMSAGVSKSKNKKKQNKKEEDEIGA